MLLPNYLNFNERYSQNFLPRGSISGYQLEGGRGGARQNFLPIFFIPKQHFILRVWYCATYISAILGGMPLVLWVGHF